MALSTHLTLIVLLFALWNIADVGGSALPPMSKNPPLFELNGRVLMRELVSGMGPRAKIDDLPDAELHDLREAGFEGIYIMGLFKSTRRSQEMAAKRLSVDDPEADGKNVVASPYAIGDYTVDDRFGGDQAISRLRARMHAQGLRLFLDFVPNHMAVDHPWTSKRPELLIQGSEEDLERNPQNFFRVGRDRIFAHGRDPYFDGWEDTVQLNYGHAELRTEMCTILAKLAGMCDGVRCDMGMLLCPEILERTWGHRLNPSDGSSKSTDPFWPDAARVARAVNPEFLIMGEVFWGRDPELQEQGFDLTFDKGLYERLVSGKGERVMEYLRTEGTGDPNMCVRYLETHDEERAAAVFSGVGKKEGQENYEGYSQLQAAAVVAYTLPGAKFLHDGQMQGRKQRMSLFSDQPAKEKRDPAASMLYATLLESIVTRPEVIEGTWGMCSTSPSMDQNPSFNNIVAYCCWDDDGNAICVVVNYSEEHSTGHVVLPEGIKVGSRTRPIPSSMRFSEDLRVSSFTSAHGKIEDGPTVLMRDLLSNQFFERKRSVLMGQHGGVWFSLEPWQAHVFDLSMLYEPPEAPKPAAPPAAAEGAEE